MRCGKDIGGKLGLVSALRLGPGGDLGLVSALQLGNR